MHVIDAYTAARNYANYETFNVYRVHAPYAHDTEEHEYWLILFDAEYERQMEHSNDT